MRLLLILACIAASVIPFAALLSSQIPATPANFLWAVATLLLSMFAAALECAVSRKS